MSCRPPIAVGTWVAPRPPHRSRRALPTHRAPTSSMSDAEPRFWPWVQDTPLGDIAFEVDLDPLPRQSMSLARPPQRARPGNDHLIEERGDRVSLSRRTRCTLCTLWPQRKSTSGVVRSRGAYATGRAQQTPMRMRRRQPSRAGCLAKLNLKRRQTCSGDCRAPASWGRSLVARSRQCSTMSRPNAKKRRAGRAFPARFGS